MDTITSESLPLGVKDICGKRYGRLLVCRFIKRRRRKFLWECICDCGNSKIIIGECLKNGRSQSCGCARLEKTRTHGLKKHPAYNTYRRMMKRCYDPKNQDWAAYGGRGITVCDRWHDIKNFMTDIGNSKKRGLSIERKDNNLGYSPDNVMWATPKVQANNTRRNKVLELDGIKLTLAQWAEKICINDTTLRGRLASGWSIRKTLETPKINNSRSKM